MSADPAASKRTRLGFWLYAGHLFTVFGIALSNGLLAVSLLASPRTLAWRSAAVRRSVERARPLLVAFGLYVLTFVASVVFSYELGRSSESLFDLFNLTSLVLALAVVSGERDARRVVDGLLVVGGVIAATGLAQYLGEYGGIDNRIRGPFSHYMTFAGFLLIVDVLLLSSMVFSSRWRQPWRWLVLLLVNLALVGSLTRSAWVGLVVALTLILVLRAPRFLILYAPASLLLVLLAPAPVLERVGSIGDLSDRSNYDRLCMIDAGLHMIAERPLVGLGPEMVEERYAIYRPASAPRQRVPHLHNSFPQLAAERGVPALVTYLFMMGVSGAAAWRLYRLEGGVWGARADLHAGVLLALVAFNSAGLFEHNWGDTEVQRVVLFLLALPFCLATGAASPEEA